MINNDESMRSEGDLNTGELRRNWGSAHLADDTKKLLDRDARVFLHQALSTPCMNVLKSCKGATLTDIEGREFLDFHGNYIHNIGFGHPAVLEAIKDQLQTLSFSTRRYTNLPAIQLAEKLTSYSPSLKRVLFTPGGAEAIGMALKIARLSTGRHKTISLWDSFHGASLDAASVGGEAMFRRNIGPLMTGTEHAPPPNPSECPFHCGTTCNLNCADYIEYILEKEGDIAAVVAETIRSTPFIPPPGYWQRIRKACDRNGTLLILDEIPHALGRTGKMFTFQHYGIEPDLLVIGKGLGGGIFPLAAVLAKDGLNEAVKDRAVGHYTHEKNPVACAAAFAALQVIEEERLLQHVANMHNIAKAHLQTLRDDFEIVYDTRALGLIMGIELRDPDSGDKAITSAEKVMYHSLEKGLNFKLSMGSTLNLTPPMNVTKSELTRAFLIIHQSLS
ncbi:MAG: aspartate aminotransferase family protein [Bacteroidetes bacterium]|jgi:4-aminobutyrate aminotransferase|nr:aspartate aminotransferase family protein [Bacteroidota bacterium]